MAVVVSSGVTYVISSGITDTGDTVLPGGTEFVSSGGSNLSATLSGDSLQGNGAEYVLAGGTAVGTTISSGGFETVSGGTSISATILAGGIESVSGGTSLDTTDNGGQLLYIYAGGTASGATVISGAMDVAGDGSTANGTTVSAGGSETLISGGSALGTTLDGSTVNGLIGDASEYVSSGGTASGTTVNFGGSQYVYTGGTTSGTTVIAGASEFVSGGTAVGTIVDAGGEYVSAGGLSISTTENSGQFFDVYSGGTASAATINGAVMNVLDGGAAIDTTLNSGGILEVTSGGVASGSVVSSGGDLVVSPNGHIFDTDLLSGGSIDATYAAFVSGATASLDASTDVLTFTTGGNTYTYQMAGDYTGETFQASDDGSGNTLITLTPCYCAGTRIRTDHGEVAVERLAAGDHVLTADGTARPVKWIGCRTLDFSRHPAPELAQPILIRADAIADGVPQRDLYVSPDHGLLLDDVLIPARLLVNGGSIQTVSACKTATYYHVELDAHDILLAENLPAESYLDTGNRGMFENSGAALILHPDLTNDQARRVAQSCRPFADAPTVVEPIWHRLAQRSVDLGLALPAAIQTTDDPALHVVIGGRTIRPLSRQGDRYIFVLPPTEAPIQLVSLATRPSSLRPWVEDRRRLGVMISRLTLRQGADVDVIPLDHPSLSRGWWDVEGDHPTLWRWTDGAATISSAPGAPTLLEVTVAHTLDYPLVEATAAGDAGLTQAA